MRLLKNQTKNLVQKIDMDSKMKKMAELQLSVVSDPKNRKAIENQVLLISMSIVIHCSCHSQQIRMVAIVLPSLGVIVCVASHFRYLTVVLL